jgi:NADH:ubiquinone oxidoreductase subunit 5 (subunit L)/multisubunit Na+/H+ antiporter MnhA subunit
MIEQLFLLIIFSPFIWMLILSILFFGRFKIKEYWLSESLKFFSLYMFALSLSLFIVTWFHSPSFLLFDYENWIEIGEYEFKLRFVIDLLGSTYAFLASALIGIIFRFSRNYLHGEEGYFRFIFLLSTLLFGLIIVSFSRSLDLLFAGWELVGTTSVLLISYFHDRPQPVVHATKAIISYRLCDMGILAAAAWAHHYLHSTDFMIIPKMLDHAHAHWGMIFIGMFVIWASLAKAGQLPMSSWLPAAMEGPTPSSAIFYGALSVHLGPFLLLRFYDYFYHFPILLVTIGVIGGVSAIYATLVGRTRSDAKTMLAYATISQVGIIYIEIALGFTNFAIFHIVTHASMRTYQFLRSSSLIQDFVENPAVEQNVPIRRKLSLEKYFPVQVRKKVYVHSLHAFHLDFFTYRLVHYFLLPMKFYMKWEERWMEYDTKLFKFFLRKD